MRSWYSISVLLCATLFRSCRYYSSDSDAITSAIWTNCVIRLAIFWFAYNLLMFCETISVIILDCARKDASSSWKTHIC